ncbi:MAG TPA: dihydroorotate dehydrogenase electron transfer subunit [Solirubrobacteraceae bacterium]|nr:dihydroorotate dehydrogenase electron transfer subunit [Solirubrobacteraceae bacterium]
MRTLAPLGRRRARVAGADDVGAYRVVHVADPGAPAPQPGQFYMLAAAEGWGAGHDERPYLPRAFSYLRAADGQLSFMLEDVGPGTHRLAQLTDGDELWLTGPFGEGFRAPDPGPPARRALLAGGGVGVPPLSAWAHALAADGAAVSAVLGFRDAHHAVGAELMTAGDVSVATDDGSVGHHGLVTDLLATALDDDDHVVVYACGPPGMLEAVRALCAARDVPAQLALEAGMACGFGACYGCVVPLAAGGYIRLCVDGPVLDADRLDAVPLHA